MRDSVQTPSAQARTLSVEDFNCMVREQFFVLQIESERALEALVVMVPKAAQRRELLKQRQVIVGADDPASAAEGERRARLTQLFGGPVDTLSASVSELRPPARVA